MFNVYGPTNLPKLHRWISSTSRYYSEWSAFEKIAPSGSGICILLDHLDRNILKYDSLVRCSILWRHVPVILCLRRMDMQLDLLGHLFFSRLIKWESLREDDLRSDDIGHERLDAIGRVREHCKSNAVAEAIAYQVLIRRHRLRTSPR